MSVSVHKDFPFYGYVELKGSSGEILYVHAGELPGLIAELSEVDLHYSQLREQYQ